MSEEQNLPETAVAEPPAAAQPAAPQPRRVRRVGTTTMGLTLIVAGIAITAGLLNPALDFSLLCKLSPLILVALGVEVLFASFTAKQARLKYDFLSMLVCAVLVCAALCGAAVAPLMQYCGPARQQAESELQDRWYDELLTELGGLAQVADLSSGLYADEWTDASQLRKEGFEAVGPAHVYVRLKGPYTDRDAFLEDCRAIVEGVRRTSVETPYLEVSWDGEEGYFHLNLDSPFAWRQSDLSTYVSEGVYETSEGDYVE